MWGKMSQNYKKSSRISSPLPPPSEPYQDFLYDDGSDDSEELFSDLLNGPGRLQSPSLALPYILGWWSQLTLGLFPGPHLFPGCVLRFLLCATSSTWAVAGVSPWPFSKLRGPYTSTLLPQDIFPSISQAMVLTTTYSPVSSTFMSPVVSIATVLMKVVPMPPSPSRATDPVHPATVPIQRFLPMSRWHLCLFLVMGTLLLPLWGRDFVCPPHLPRKAGLWTNCTFLIGQIKTNENCHIFFDKYFIKRSYVI